LIIECDNVEDTTCDISVICAAGVGFEFTVTPAAAGDGAGVAEVERPLRGVDIATGAAELLVENQVGHSVDGGNERPEDPQKCQHPRAKDPSENLARDDTNGSCGIFLNALLVVY